jgi:riboflavin biosynthesis pyrimidine reductase
VTPLEWRRRFDAICARRTDAAAVPLPPVRTVTAVDLNARVEPVGNEWSRSAFDGPFYQSVTSAAFSIGVVFVRSGQGNTGASDPSSFGGGAVDEHLIYEGLSRAAADGVVVGGGTLHADSFFSVWRRELVDLRRSLGLPRHPVQIVMSADGSVDLERVLLFNVPDVRVFVITSARGQQRLSSALALRPWVTPVTGDSLRQQFDAFRAQGFHRLCSVGGRRSATELVDANLVQDVYLTTTTSTRGEPNTPWYVGNRKFALHPVVAKEWDGPSGVVRFKHSVLA